MVREVAERLGGLGVLVNSAGYTEMIPFPDLDAISEEIWDRVMAVNVKGPFLCARAAAPSLRRAARRSSTSPRWRASARPGPRSLRGLEGGADPAHARARARPRPAVRVNGVAPGVVASHWFTHLIGGEGAEEVYETAKAGTPLGRTLEPPDVSQIVLALPAADGSPARPSSSTAGGRSPASPESEGPTHRNTDDSGWLTEGPYGPPSAGAGKQCPAAPSLARCG